MGKIGIGLFALTLAVPLIGPSPSFAEGALAIGSTGNVVDAGIAIGNSYNYSTREEAVDAALKKCHEYKAAPRAARECMIVGTYSGQCYAEALDPKAGTPGAGWAIATDEQQASSLALGSCRATAGSSRRDFCKVVDSGCDTKD
jgi:hypothetical protein